MAFHIPVLSHLLFLPFQYMANVIYKRADDICAVSESYVSRVLRVNRKCKNGHSVFLGTCLKKFDENSNNKHLLKR